WSMHQSTNNVSINVDPETGKPDILQFATIPPNSMALRDFAAVIPSSLLKTPLYRLPLTLEQDKDSIPVPVSSSSPSESKESEADFHDSFVLGADSGPEGELRQEAEADEVAEGEGETHTDRGDNLCRNGIDLNERLKHLLWDWKDVVREATGGSALTAWEDLVVKDAADGEKYERIVRSGNLLLVAAAMKGQLGEIDWEELIAEYEQSYAEADFSNGGTIRDWVNSLRKSYSDGEKIKPFRPELSKDEIEECRQLVVEIMASLTKRRPSEEYLFHVLLCLCRLMKGSPEQQISVDFLARRSGLNPYHTWEEQKAAEFDETNSSYMNGEYPKHPRDYPSSIAARMKLGRLLHYLCDMNGQVSGTKPFVRIKVGVPSWASTTGLAEGSLFRKVDRHSFWFKASAAA
ncbi:MAG: hypothetical protein WCP92_10165, partial [bacterium]